MKMVTLRSALLVSWTISLTVCNTYTKNGQTCTKGYNGKQYCYKNDGFAEDVDPYDSPYEDEAKLNKRERLFIWDPVKVGYARQIELEPGKKINNGN